eukprot:gene6375-biopygen6334
MYFSVGFTQSIKLLGSVHGVVVHARKLMLSSWSHGNVTTTEGSGTSLSFKWHSKLERTVVHPMEYGITLYPWYTRPLSQSSWNAHQTDSMYERFMVL